MFNKKVTAIETSKFDTLEGVKGYVNGLNEMNLVNMDIDAPKVYEKKWVVTITWMEEGV